MTLKKKSFVTAVMLLLIIAPLWTQERISYQDVAGNRYVIDGEFVNWCTARLSNKKTYILLEESYYNPNTKSWADYKEVDRIPTSRYSVDSYMRMIEGKGILMEDTYLFLNVQRYSNTALSQGDNDPYFWKEKNYTYYLVKIYRVLKYY